MGETFEDSFDAFVDNFLSTPSDEIDDHEIRKFLAALPADYRPNGEKYDKIVKMLLKIKDIPRNAVFNDTLALIQKWFNRADFNKFLMLLWNSEEIKNRELGPIGFSYTDGHHKFDYSSMKGSHNEITDINVKAIETAWSMALDLEATVNAMITSYMTDKAMSVFHLIIFRRFKCLGDYKVNVDGAEIPVIIYFFRNLLKDERLRTDRHKLNILISMIISISWSPKGNYCWPCIKPNYVLSEIMKNLVSEADEEQSWLLGLHRIFNPIDNFRCDIEWNSTSKDFDNPTLFFCHFIKYYNRKQAIHANDSIRNILERFKKSLRHVNAKITNLNAFEGNIESDWPFCYFALKLLDVQDFKFQIPASIYKALPEEYTSKYIDASDSEMTREKALVEIFELALMAGNLFSIPDEFCKNLWKAYGDSGNLVQIVAEAIISAWMNLKGSLNIVVDRNILNVIGRICQNAIDYSHLDVFSNVFEMNFDYISRCHNIFVIGRVVRIYIEKECSVGNRRKPHFKDANEFFKQCFGLFVMRSREKFQDIGNSHQGYWQPWRKGNAPCMSDDKSMAINYILNFIQKEAFCIFDSVFGFDEKLLDFLFYLHKQRRYFGVAYNRVDELISKHFPVAEHPPRGNEQNYPPRGGMR